jgi:putative ABC transport system permease protein
MKMRDHFELAGRNLREAKLRNALTTLGIAVGVASLVAMLALGVGLQKLASDRFSRSGLFDTLVVFSGSEFRGGDRGGRDPEESRPRRPLDDSVRAEIAAMPNVLEVYPDVRFSATVLFEGKSQFTTVTGLSLSVRSDEAFDDIKGSFFSGDDAPEVILQREFARRFSAQPESLIGREMSVRYAAQRAPASAAAGRSGGVSTDFVIETLEKKVRVVGIIESEPFAGLRGFGRGRVFAPAGFAESLRTVGSSDLRSLVRNPSATRTFFSLIVKMRSPTHVPAAEKAIEQMGFSTFSLLEATRNLRRFFAVLDIFLGIFGSLALAVASLGIINTLVMAILERRREIGIMKALGASDGDVKKLFFLEAAAMGFAGGVFGVALGALIGRAINFGTGLWMARQQLPPETVWQAPWWLVLSAIVFSVMVSLASGLYPAARAAKLDPVQALRYE